MEEQENKVCGQTCDCTNYCKMNNPIFEDNTPPQPATVEEAVECYAAQSPNQWREKELPEVGHHVEVITEYESKGYPASARFIGYLNEEGDLISLPDDDHYGWTFEECVTYWRYLSEPPTTK